MTHHITPLQKALNLWAVLVLIWGIYRFVTFDFPSNVPFNNIYKFFPENLADVRTHLLPHWIDEFISKPLLFVLPVFYFITKVEKRTLEEGLNFNTKNIVGDIVVSLFIGLVFIGVGVFANYSKTGLLMPMDKTVTFWSALYFSSVSLATGITEEIISRGFILKRLFEDSNNMYTASLFASFLFFFMHIPMFFTNDNLRGAALIQVMITDIVLSLIASLMYLDRKSLTVPILIHTFYNLSLYLLVQGV